MTFFFQNKWIRKKKEERRVSVDFATAFNYLCWLDKDFISIVVNLQMVISIVNQYCS